MKLTLEDETGDTDENVGYSDYTVSVGNEDSSLKTLRENIGKTSPIIMGQKSQNDRTNLPEKEDHITENKRNPKEQDIVDLVTKMKRCQVQEQSSSGISDITDNLSKVTLNNQETKVDEDKKEKQKRRNPEDNEVITGDQDVEEDPHEKEKTDVRPIKETDSEEEESAVIVNLAAPQRDQKPQPEQKDEKPSVLKERGPNGIPVHHTGEQHQILSYMPMPPAFPNYSQEHLIYANCDGSKRHFDDMMDQQEAPKYFRPQIPLNDLNGPGMSSIVNTDQEYFTGTSIDGRNFTTSSCQQFQNSFGQFTNNSVPSSNNSNLFKSDDIPGDEVFQLLNDVENHMTQNIPHLPQHHQKQPREVFDDVTSEGYDSDRSNGIFSPSPSMSSQFSPPSCNAASPRSNASPRLCNWSPPPSNLSADSGVHSPMSEDLNNYLGNGGWNTKTVACTKSQNKSGFISCTVAQPQLTLTGKPSGLKSPHQQTFGQIPLQQEMTIPAPTVRPLVNGSTVSSAYSTFEVASKDDCSNDGSSNEYINSHLPELHDALQVATDDLMKGNVKCIAYQQQQKLMPTHSSFPETKSNLSCSASTTLRAPITNVPNIISGPNTTPSMEIKEMKPAPSIARKKDSPSPLVMDNPTAAQCNDHLGNNVDFNKLNISQIKGNSDMPVKNKEGKFQIAPCPKTKNTAPTPLVLLVMPPNVSSVAQKPRFQAIKPKGQFTELNGNFKVESTNGYNNLSNVNPALKSNENGHFKAANRSGCNDGKKPNSILPANKLTMARRMVAEVETSQLKYVDDDGDTYLHVATLQTDECLVQALLERLVRDNLISMTDAQNSQKQTPLYLAVSSNRPEMVQLLVNNGADVNKLAECEYATGVQSMACIHRASSEGVRYLSTLKALLTAKHIKLNLLTSEGHTALTCAIQAHGKKTTDNQIIDSVPIIQTLLQAGANPNQQIPSSGKTDLMYVVESRNLDLVESVFQVIEPNRLQEFLKTEAFDGSTCHKIADQWRLHLDPVNRQRLQFCFNPRSARRR